jgi:Ni,Fe-hydrogenase III large subunit
MPSLFELLESVQLVQNSVQNKNLVEFVEQQYKKTLNDEIRKFVIREIEAFSGDYSHKVEGRDVIIVEQVIDFLSVPSDIEQLGSTD